MEQTLDCPPCYGKYAEKGTDCPDCVYLDSCKWYTLSDTGRSTHGGVVSLEASGRLSEIEAHTCRESRREGLPETQITLRDLAAFARYLLSLDDLSLGVIQDMISGKMTISEIAAGRGVSRQAVHHKLLRCIHYHPELGALFMALMPKLSAARRRMLRNNARTKKGEKKK